MSGDDTNAKPRRLPRRGLAQSTWRLVAITLYPIEMAGAITGPLLLSLAAFGAGYGVALRWGGQL